MIQPDTLTVAPAARQTQTCCAPGACEPVPGGAEEMAEVFKAIGHPIRLQILWMLGQARETVCVCDLEQPFAVKQPTISHHLRVLREAGLVESEQRGTWVHYRLRAEAIATLRQLLGGLCC